MSSYTVDEYQIGIISALPKELRAVKAVLDKEHAPLQGQQVRDCNSYVLGRVHQHNVVAAGLPAGVYGTTSAASVGKDMLRTFPQLRFVLLVGIAGGIPNNQTHRDIRLGDVVVGQPDATHGGIVQYDLGKLLSDGHFVRKSFFNKPPQALLTALTCLQAEVNDNAMNKYLEEVDKKHPGLKENRYSYRGANQDQLHCTKCDTFQSGMTPSNDGIRPLRQCELCQDGTVNRPPRPSATPVVHYGTIASGNTLLKNATQRDQLGKDLGALCVEMEAAGMGDYPCLVIRGICDYADAHKNDV